MKRFLVEISKGRFRIQGFVQEVGQDLLISTWGGTRFHIGAVGIAIPRPSLKNPKKWSATSSNFTFIGHKEDALVKKISEKLAAQLRRNVVVTAGKLGIPQIITPCGFDMLSCGPLERGDRGDPLWVSKDIKNRKLFIPDAFRVQARTNPQELKEIAGEVARKLNRSRGPVAILIPLKGWSSLDKEGMPLYDPVGDRAFLDELKIHIDPKIPIIELNLHLNTREFAQEAVNQFLNLYSEDKRRRC